MVLTVPFIFSGECWSGPSPAADTEYNKHGKGGACYGPGYRMCRRNDANCVGANSHIFVYEIGKFSKYFYLKSRICCYSVVVVVRVGCC
jgi:hypothetical protein